MKIKKILFLAFVILGLIGAAYVYSLTQVKLVDVTMNDIEEMTLEDFTLTGKVILKNNGLLSVKIEGLDYKIVLEESEEVIAEGHVAGEKISAGEKKEFPFTTTIGWAPTAKLALSLLDDKNTVAEVKGTVYIAGFGDLSIPFSAKINLEKYVKQFAVNKAKEALGSVVDGLTGIFS